MDVSGLCYCNACVSRRAVLGNETLKIESCDAQRALDYAFDLNKRNGPEIAQDAVVEANRKLLLDRSKVGVAKYGVTLAGSGLSRRQLLQHALEEALDMANYLQAEIMREDAKHGGD